MKYAQFLNRVAAGIIDHIVVIVCFFITIIITEYIQFYPMVYKTLSVFVLITIAISPIQVLLNLVFLYNYQDFIVLMIFFIIEILYYSLYEIFLRRTIGFRLAEIKIEYQGKKYRILKILLRNSLKTLSRYLFGLPLLTMFLSKKRQAFYDILSGAVVYEVEKEN